MHQKLLGSRAPPGPAEELKRSPDTLATVKGLGPQEVGKGREREEEREEGRERQGPQVKNNDPPSSNGWL